jgi:hypothetical protein
MKSSYVNFHVNVVQMADRIFQEFLFITILVISYCQEAYILVNKK